MTILTREWRARLRAFTTITSLAALPLVALPPTAQAADPAPTDVQISWANAQHTMIHVTWHETVAVANIISSTHPLDENAEYRTPADGPNAIDIPAGLFFKPTENVAVWVAAPGQRPTSPPGLSAPFDASRPSAPVVDSLTRVATNRFSMKWHPGPPVVDPNPGDPLDVVVPTEYDVSATFGTVLSHSVTPRSTATQGSFTMGVPPASEVFVSAYNEWGAWSTPLMLVGYERLSQVTIPAAVDYGTSAPVTGRVQRWEDSCDKQSCVDVPAPPEHRSVVLEARDTPSSPWYVVANVKAFGTFSVSPTALGTRQYRTRVPDLTIERGLDIGTASGPVTTVAKPRVSARMLTPAVKYGQQATAHMAMAPGANVPSILQRWDGSVWRNVKTIQLAGGAGNAVFASTTRGRVAYRFLVPAFTYGGRSLSWRVSPNLVLTTS